MKGLDIARILAEAVALERMGPEKMGVSWGFGKAVLPAIDPATGIQFVGRYNCGEFKGTGEPQLYLLTITASYEPNAIGIAVPQAGLLQAVVTNGIGAAQSSLTIDVGIGASILVPGGPISVQVLQTGPYVFGVQALNVSIAKYPGTKFFPATFTERPTGRAFAGPPPVIVYDGVIPLRAKTVRLNHWYQLGLYTLQITADGTNGVAQFDTGTDRHLLMQGAKLPPNARYYTIIGPNLVGDSPTLTFELE